jgi:hypothetical protein
MNNSQTNKRAMYRTIDTFGIEQAVALEVLPSVAATLAELKALAGQIDEAAKVQRTKSSGITQSKAAQKKEMARQAVEVAASISVLATKTSNLELKEMVNYSASHIAKLTDAEAIVVGNLIHEQAVNNLNDAAPFGLTTAAVDNLRAAIDNFSKMTGKRSSSKGTKVAATAGLDKLFTQANALLRDVLDKLLLTLQTSQPTLYAQYLNARQIIDLGSRKKPGEDNGKDGGK